jgi:hypothetical protein
MSDFLARILERRPEIAFEEFDRLQQERIEAINASMPQPFDGNNPEPGLVGLSEEEYIAYHRATAYVDSWEFAELVALLKARHRKDRSPAGMNGEASDSGLET